MCKQGIKIGRKTTVATVNVVAPNADGVRALSRREDRISIIVSMSTGSNPSAFVYPAAIVRNFSRAAKGFFGALNTYAPQFVATIEEYGECVRNEIWIGSTGGGAVGVSVTEVYLTEVIDEVA